MNDILAAKIKKALATSEEELAEMAKEAVLTAPPEMDARGLFILGFKKALELIKLNKEE